MDIRALSRRRLGRITMACVFVAALGVSGWGSGLAGAAPSQKAEIQYGNESCGNPILGAPVIGTVSFQRHGDTMTVTYALSDGDANTEYGVSLWDGDTCTAISFLGFMTTNDKGRARIRVPGIDVSGHTTFYARGFDDTYPIYHGSLAVVLPA